MGRRRDRSGSDGEKGGKKRGGLGRIAKLGVLAGAVALLKDSGRRGKVVQKGKGAVAKAGPVGDRAGSLLGKAREGVSRMRNR